jgi:tetratricopeptide repeat protein 30
VEDYKVYHAQALYKAGLYSESARACIAVDSAQYSQRVLKLQSAVRYEQDELAQARQFVEQCLPDDPDVVVAQGCLLYKEAKYEEAKTKFSEAMNQLGYQPLLAYNLALCYYRYEWRGSPPHPAQLSVTCLLILACLRRQRLFPQALKEVAQIIERGIREHPGLCSSSRLCCFRAVPC